MKMVKKVLYFLWLVIFLAFVFINCSGDKTEKIIVPGLVDGDIVTLKAMVSGTVQSFNLEEGGQVTLGSMAAEIDSAKIENQLIDLEINSRDIDIKYQSVTRKIKYLNSNIQYLNKQVQRFRRLNEKKALPGEKLETMELKLQEAETSRFELRKTLESLQVQREKIQNKKEYLDLLLKDHIINSPVSGVVMETFVTRGESVFPGTSIADILDTSSLYVEVFVEEKEIATIKLNQKVIIKVDGRDKNLHGVISYFGKKAEFSPKYIISEKERRSLLYQVKIKINNSGGYLKIGMPVTVIIDGSHNKNYKKKSAY